MCRTGRKLPEQATLEAPLSLCPLPSTILPHPLRSSGFSGFRLRIEKHPPLWHTQLSPSLGYKLRREAWLGREGQTPGRTYLRNLWNDGETVLEVPHSEETMGRSARDFTSPESVTQWLPLDPCGPNHSV